MTVQADLYCPYCAARLADTPNGELQCPATGAFFSKHIVQRLREGYTSGRRPAETPFPGGISGPWFCPGDGAKLHISGEHAICPVCERQLNEFIYELYRLNPHLGPGAEGPESDKFLWRRFHRATSPDGRYVASIDPAYEVSMGNPTAGTFCLSAGLHLPGCNPSFLWSEDSQYIAVPQFFRRLGLIRRQRLVIVALRERAVFESEETAYYFFLTLFSATQLSVIANPFRHPRQLTFSIPGDLKLRFRRSAGPWAEGPCREET